AAGAGPAGLLSAHWGATQRPAEFPQRGFPWGQAREICIVQMGAGRRNPAVAACQGPHVMRGALGGPRVLLRRLREVMAEPVSAQDRLDKIVVLIAANMVAEVCSVYVLRVDGTLELYATEGLNRQAVHQTVMRANEGLVGLVSREAKSINLSDAHSHPAFSY